MANLEKIYGVSIRCLYYNQTQTITLSDKPKSVLRVATVSLWSKWTGSYYRFCDFYGEILLEMGCRLGQDLSIEHSTEQFGGGKLPNGSYNGLMRYIYENKSDLIMAPMVYAPHRLAIAESAGFLEFANHMSFLDSPKPQQNNLFAIIHCLTTEIWVLALITYIFYACVNTGQKNFFRVATSFIDHFSLLLQQSLSLNTKLQFQYRPFLLISWLFSAFFFSNFFTSDMLAKMTFKPKSIIDSVDEIYADKSIRPLIVKAGYLYNAHLKGSALDSRLEFVNYLEYFGLNTVNRILRERAVLIAKEDFIDNIIESNPYLPLRKCSEGKFLLPSGFLLHKAMPPQLKKSTRKLNRKFHEYGIIKSFHKRMHLIKSTSAKAKIDKKTLEEINSKLSSDFDVLKLDDVDIAFLLALVGFVLSTVFLIFESRRLRNENFSKDRFARQQGRRRPFLAVESQIFDRY